ncbi:hypothetical protein KO500_05945 [Cellulophaga baltica]|uniref:DUF6427 family protein n=1 Tax=Cellulophaga TaxID=104264 RepID=UPI001C068146|nr:MULTISPECIES: DUF6427 family protein [Cellulophaga]MBU2995964.1 hypothetical protein [Cellulophaga baltica]MDO6767359.1 DUF6427 family protein [Cellulophaga sp. 1_MG-2023]
MISSIFGKTKPINFIIILTFLFVFYWVTVYFIFSTPFITEHLLGYLPAVSALLINVLLIDFIIKRNKITGSNSFTILYFALLIIVFPEILMDQNSIYCTFFILLAVRRLLSIKSLKDVKRKIFDATLWILISSLFYDLALLYLVLIYVTIYIYDPKNIRNWLVPIIAIITFSILLLMITTLIGQKDFILNHYQFSVKITWEYILEWKSSLKVILYIPTALTLIIFTFIKLASSGQGRINTMRLVTVFFFVGLIITIIKSTHEIAPILITFFATSVFMTNYIENIKKPKIKEVILISSIIVPLIVLLVRYT